MVMRRALRKVDVTEQSIRTVMALHTDDFTLITTDTRPSESFHVKAGFHQGSVFSPLLFSVVVDIVSSKKRSGLHYEFYTDDSVLVAPMMEELSRPVDEWSMSSWKRTEGECSII